jgi:hypothetical protein
MRTNMSQLLNWSSRWSVSPQEAFHRKECAAAFPLPPQLIFDEGIIFNHCLKVHCTKGQGLQYGTRIEKTGPNAAEIIHVRMHMARRVRMF